MSVLFLLLSSTLAASFSPALAIAQQFSAEIVDVDPRNHSKMFAGDAKVRFDSDLESGGSSWAVILWGTDEESLEPGEPFRLIVDRGEQVTYVVLPWRKAFTRLSGAPFPWIMLRPFDPENPCEAWMEKAKETCQKIGDATINGRNTVEFDVFSPTKKRKLRMWFDAALGWIVRVQNGRQVLELRDIRVEPQPDTLFEVPQDYREIKSKPLKKEWWEKIPLLLPDRP